MVRASSAAKATATIRAANRRRRWRTLALADAGSSVRSAAIAVNHTVGIRPDQLLPLFSAHAHQSAVRAQLLLRLQDALNSMAAVDREILSMCHFEELRDEEVALVLGIDKGAAAIQYIRALKQLREILKNIPGFFDQL